MKRLILILFFFISGTVSLLFSQENPENSKLDILLIRGEYNKVIDTCKQILATDSLNADVYYKMGIAYQNLIADDNSLECFTTAAIIAPDNNQYNFMVARGFYLKGKFNHAKLLLEKLCSVDSMNWVYAYYLTSIYIQDEKYDESLKIYARFYDRDSSNYVILDKIGFANLKKGMNARAIYLFNRSLELNKKNINAIKNLAYLYTVTLKWETALQLLTKGIEIDPSEMDLYARRATINYSLNYTKRALDDYLKILSSGDSSVLFLKRAGIGYANNLQPEEAVKYLLLAYAKDPNDMEVSAFLARSYYKLKDYSNSVFYYKHIIETLEPYKDQLAQDYILLGEALKSEGSNKEAIDSYIKSQTLRSDPSIDLIIANLYDEKLKNPQKAIYYELYLKKIRTEKMNMSDDYIESVRKRVEALKNPIPGTK
jgi:tetratricopeptide (TPR) repeat protein